MNSNANRVRPRGSQRAALAAMAACACLAWGLLLTARHTARGGRVELPTVAIEGSVGNRVALHTKTASAGPSLAQSTADLPIMPAGPATIMRDRPVRPHPITKAHERIYRENNLVGALNLAVDLEDAARIRALVTEYRAEYPQDDHVLQEGYAIIAECLDHLNAATRARARRFWSTHIRSQTRRYVRRHCLDDETPGNAKATRRTHAIAYRP